MKKNSLLLVIGLCVVLAVTGSATANTTYTETINIYRVVTYNGSGFNPGSFYWYHQNPAEISGGGPMTPEQYEAAVLAGSISDVTLTITVDDLNQGESVETWILDKNNNLVYLGNLDTMAAPVSSGLIYGPEANPGHRSITTFNLIPSWLDGLPVKVQLGGGSSPLEVETSTLSVAVATIPAPGAILLGSIGICLVGWLRRRRVL